MTEPRAPRPRRFDRLLDPSAHILRTLEDSVVDPAWKRVTEGESSIPAIIAIGVAVTLEATLAARVAIRPRGLVIGLGIALLLAVVIVSPRRLDRRSRLIRGVTLLVIALISLMNMVSAARLVIDLVNEEGIRDAGRLLVTGGSIWLTNVIVFSLWYWQFDRGGPTARALTPKAVPDLLFPQMQTPGIASADWRPEYFDYLYLSFTNAMAFSPTDVMPLSRWTKMTMLLQSLVSLVIGVLVIARAVNVLG
jgi:uncharacterized membrane protein